MFKNNGGFDFTELAAQVGMDQETFSTGAAYADLDNDGDLDLIVNNLNGEVFIFKNNSESLFSNHFIQLDLGQHFGAQVTILAGEKMWYAEHNPVKGYMSSVDPRMHFGLGKVATIDALEVIWPNGSVTQIENPALDTIHVLGPNEEVFEYDSSSSMVQTLLEEVKVDFPWQHQESDFIDFDRDRLRFHMISNEGPNPAVADIDGDGLDDIFFPGAKGQASVILKQMKNGTFKVSQTFEAHKLSEDVAGVFFDANGNGWMDLYVVSGSLEFGIGNANYQDRLYLNDGKGNFTQSVNGLPRELESSAFALPLDFDQDGNMDMVVGVRNIPFAYGLPGDLKLYRNTGDATFERINVPEFEKLGMLTDVVLADVDNDGQEELIVVGEWMPVKVFKILDGSFHDISANLGFENSSGLWNSVTAMDMDGDGHVDLFLGNTGTNTRLTASENEPLRMYVNDFDQNGSVEQILTVYEDGKEFPFVLKSSLLKQLPGLRKQLLTYDAYKDKKMEDLFAKDILDNSLVLEVKTLSSALYKNQGNGTFVRENLPPEVQYAPIYACLTVTDQNNTVYLLLGGNQSRIKPELGIQMGSYGWLLQPVEAGKMSVIPAEKSGFYVEGEVRDIQQVNTAQGILLMVSRNNNSPKWYKVKE